MNGGGYGCKAGTADGCDRAGRRGTRHARAVGSTPEVVSGSGAAVPDRAGDGRGPLQQGHRRRAGVPSRDGGQVALAVRRAAPRRALRRPAAGSAAHHRRRRRRGGDRAHLGVRAGRRDALVDAVDGQGSGHLAVVGARHLGGVRSQAPPRRGFQAVAGPAVHRQGPRCRGAVPEPPRGRGRALRGRKDPHTGPGPHRPDPAADARHAPAAHPRLPPPRHHQPVRGARHRLGQRHHVDDGAAPLRRIQKVLEPHRQRSPLPPRRPRRGRQRLHPQDPRRQTPARRAPPLQAPASPPPTAPR